MLCRTARNHCGGIQQAVPLPIHIVWRLLHETNNAIGCSGCTGTTSTLRCHVSAAQLVCSQHLTVTRFASILQASAAMARSLASSAAAMPGWMTLRRCVSPCSASRSALRSDIQYSGPSLGTRTDLRADVHCIYTQLRQCLNRTACRLQIIMICGIAMSAGNLGFLALSMHQRVFGTYLRIASKPPCRAENAMCLCKPVCWPVAARNHC
jgi:hypothetical protein